MQNFLKNPRRIPNRKQNLKFFPKTPGIYVFWQKNKVIYIGKAINLKARISSYFSLTLAPKTRRMTNEASDISILKVNSEIEALLLEAKLIQSYQPRYNATLKDDKHPLYIKIVKSAYPYVATARKITPGEKFLAVFGPFPSSQAVRGILRQLRRILPFADHLPAKKVCFYSQLGFCSPCPSLIEQTKNQRERKDLLRSYRRNIRLLKAVLSGRFRTVRKSLEMTMRNLAESEKFEEAAEIRSKINRLDYITQPTTDVNLFLENPNLAEDLRKRELTSLQKMLRPYLKLPTSLRRIECFDVAHLKGSFATASMVTFILGEADKNYYRHFRIYQKDSENDLASLAEVARRRAKHLLDWGKPDLIVVDGGKNQISAFLKIFAPLKIPVVGLAKQRESLIIPQKGSFITLNLKSGPALNLLQRLRNEAHRFARVYHHRLLAAGFLTSSLVSDHTKKK